MLKPNLVPWAVGFHFILTFSQVFKQIMSCEGVSDDDDDDDAQSDAPCIKAL